MQPAVKQMKERMLALNGEVEDLETIAQMSYSGGGEAAYQAMALLSYAYQTPVFYDCEDLELKESNASKTNFALASVHPNPTTGIFTIENYCLEGPLYAELLNEFGIVVLMQNIATGPSQVNISINKYPAGFYVLHLTGCKTSMHQLIIKIQ